MISLHHTHLMATDVNATIAFWRDGFGADVVYDTVFAGARNVFLRLGEGRIHLYDQPPRTPGQATVHHLGVLTDDIYDTVHRLRALGIPVTDVRDEPTASYAMAQGPDQLLIEIFQPDPARVPADVRGYFGITP